MTGESGRVRLIAGGDVMLGRDVREAIVRHGPTFPFAKVQPLLEQADIRFANLECALPAPGEAFPESRCRMWAPWECALGLVNAQFDVLSLANNHILDHGMGPARSTAEFCKRHGIAPLGFGETAAEARRAHVVHRNGLSVAFLAYTDAYAAGGPGPARLEAEAMHVDVREARRCADAVVVSMHSDLEFVHHPAPWRLALCRSLVEAGATVVLGHHPHVPQGVERHGDGLIAYSLGNFVYDATTRAYVKEGSPYSAQSFLLDVVIEAGGVTSHAIHPFRIDEDHRPCLLSGDGAADLRNAIARWSADLADPRKVMDAWVDTCLRYVGVTLETLFEAYTSGGAEAVLQNELPLFLRGPFRPFADQLVEIIDELERQADEPPGPLGPGPACCATLGTTAR